MSVRLRVVRTYSRLFQAARKLGRGRRFPLASAIDDRIRRRLWPTGLGIARVGTHELLVDPQDALGSELVARGTYEAFELDLFRSLLDGRLPVAVWVFHFLLLCALVALFIRILSWVLHPAPPPAERQARCPPVRLLKDMLAALSANGYRASTLIEQIVLSDAFQYRYAGK